MIANFQFVAMADGEISEEIADTNTSEKKTKILSKIDICLLRR